MRIRALIAALVLALTPMPLVADTDPVFAARKAAEDLTAASRALKDAREARDQISALSRAIKAYEDGLTAMRDSLRKAAIRAHSLRMEFDARQAELSRLLGVIQTLERATSPLLLIHPSGPLGTARSGQLLSEITPALVAKTEDLRAQIEELALLTALQTTALEDLKAGLAGVQDARVALATAIADRTNLPRRYAADPDRLQLLAANAETLNGFASGLADLPFDETGDDPVDFDAMKGQLPLPVYGTLLRDYQEADAAGVRRPGILISAPPVSLVTSPVAATIRYLGPLLDYGNVIILEPEAGYLIVLAGLGQVYGEVGQILGQGEPVGLLRGTDPAAGDFLVEAREGSREIQAETLYIEIRAERDAVDPGIWFALR